MTDHPTRVRDPAAFERHIEEKDVSLLSVLSEPLLMELHTESYQDVGTEMIRDEADEAQNTLTAEIKDDD